MKKEDFLAEMDDVLKEGVHTPGNLSPRFDWKFFDSTRGLEGGGTRGRLDHTYYLFHYASVLPNNSLIVDIGIGCGGESVIALGMGIRGKNSKIVAIDPGLMTIEKVSKRAKELYKYGIQFLDTNLIITNVKKADLENYVILVGNTSDEIFNEWNRKPIDMLYIDGSHKYEYIKMDCQWLKYVRDDGVVVFDNWSEPVKKAVLEFMSDKPEWELLTESIAQPPRHPWKTVFWKNKVDKKLIKN